MENLEGSTTILRETETTAEEVASQIEKTSPMQTDSFAGDVTVARGTASSVDGVCEVNTSTRCADLAIARETMRDLRKTVKSFY